MPDNHHLLNCPFCGRQPREIVKLTIYHSIVCVCGIVITRDTQEEARTTWNTRVPDTELIEAAENVLELYHLNHVPGRDIERELHEAFKRMEAILAKSKGER